MKKFEVVVHYEGAINYEVEAQTKKKQDKSQRECSVTKVTV